MTAKIKNRNLHSSNHPKHRPKGVGAKAFERVYWPYLPLLIMVGLLLLFGGQSGPLLAAVQNPGGKVLAYSTSMSVSGLLSESNSQRSANGVPGLAGNGQLNAAAQAKANDMATRNYWSHNTPEGNPPWTFVTAQGYSYQKIGENLAAGFSSEQTTVAGWMASPPHRENLLDPAYSDVGFGFANNENYTSAGGGPMTIVVAFYGKPTSAPAAAPAVAPAPPPATTKSAQASTPAPQPPAAETPAQQPQPSAGTAQQTPAPAAATRSKAVNSDNPASSGIALGSETSRAEIAFARMPFSAFATSLAAFGVITAVCLWVSHHLLAAKRAWAFSETFAIKHPLFDISLVTIAALSYLMTQTVGLIQ